MCQVRRAERYLCADIGFKRIDLCMLDELRRLNSRKPKTLAHCCGHGRYPKTIVIKDRRKGIIEYYTGIKIPRKRRFYVKDLNGFYYIPETVEFVVGSGATGPDDVMKPCIYCGKELFFSDKWDWERKIPLCMGCGVKEKIIGEDNWIITQETQENTKRITGMNDYEMEGALSNFREHVKEKVKEAK